MATEDTCMPHMNIYNYAQTMPTYYAGIIPLCHSIRIMLETIIIGTADNNYWARPTADFVHHFVMW